MRAREGRGEAIGHHGELLQGVFEVEGARLRRGLVSLPCRHLTSKAEFRVTSEESVSVVPRRCEKAGRAAELALQRFAQAGTGGHLTVESNIPVGRGMGSSTADVLASILAVLDYLRIQVSPDFVMQLAVNAETACDSTLFSGPAVLFAHREGIVIESFKKSLPPIDLVSIDTTPGKAVDTLEFEPAQYSPAEIESFRPLRALLRHAVNISDLTLLGRVATASTRINERFLPKPRLNDIEAIGVLHGALGVQAAHSGTVVGLMFDPTSENTAERLALAVRDLRNEGFEASIVAQ
ncbi:GHMP kinase [Mesorhizobium sp.]|uniref:GHMP family kinase ATP-binding protein n=1 Tax=Mesorhizobium sp. TaxID=1871066 RepID=UPI000FE57D7D|nr:GHMP kinase [Mesorhizobium sp.]RWD82942.1 MAG: GHMP kinase [Mesorhizobium sp.]RWD83345.1 MAG: GHMP kinase [Mesorhizobium sp.]